LAFEKLPQALLGLSYCITYKPVLLGALLRHHGQLGPAEIPAKQAWLYRHVQWLAQQQQLPLQRPGVHPFNPLPLLRLALACKTKGTPSRFVCETLFRHVWQSSADALAPARLQNLHTQLNPQADANSPAIKAQLRTNTDEAIALGVFGVPSLLVDGHLFWGLDALGMLVDYLQGAREGLQNGL
jgi:2-hydroxychromene-2-carboxylate isomerase